MGKYDNFLAQQAELDNQGRDAARREIMAGQNQQGVSDELPLPAPKPGKYARFIQENFPAVEPDQGVTDNPLVTPYQRAAMAEQRRRDIEEKSLGGTLAAALQGAKDAPGQVVGGFVGGIPGSVAGPAGSIAGSVVGGRLGDAIQTAGKSPDERMASFEAKDLHPVSYGIGNFLPNLLLSGPNLKDPGNVIKGLASGRGVVNQATGQTGLSLALESLKPIINNAVSGFAGQQLNNQLAEGPHIPTGQELYEGAAASPLNAMTKTHEFLQPSLNKNFRNEAKQQGVLRDIVNESVATPESRAKAAVALEAAQRGENGLNSNGVKIPSSGVIRTQPGLEDVGASLGQNIRSKDLEGRVAAQEAQNISAIKGNMQDVLSKQSPGKPQDLQNALAADQQRLAETPLAKESGINAEHEARLKQLESSLANLKQEQDKVSAQGGGKVAADASEAAVGALREKTQHVKDAWKMLYASTNDNSEANLGALKTALNDLEAQKVPGWKGNEDPMIGKLKEWVNHYENPQNPPASAILDASGKPIQGEAPKGAPTIEQVNEVRKQVGNQMGAQIPDSQEMNHAQRLAQLKPVSDALTQIMGGAPGGEAYKTDVLPLTRGPIGELNQKGERGEPFKVDASKGISSMLGPEASVEDVKRYIQGAGGKETPESISYMLSRVAGASGGTSKGITDYLNKYSEHFDPNLTPEATRKANLMASALRGEETGVLKATSDLAQTKEAASKISGEASATKKAMLEAHPATRFGPVTPEGKGIDPEALPNAIRGIFSKEDPITAAKALRKGASTPEAQGALENATRKALSEMTRGTSVEDIAKKQVSTESMDLNSQEVSKLLKGDSGRAALSELLGKDSPEVRVFNQSARQLAAVKRAAESGDFKKVDVENPSVLTEMAMRAASTASGGTVNRYAAKAAGSFLDRIISGKVKPEAISKALTDAEFDYPLMTELLKPWNRSNSKEISRLLKPYILNEKDKPADTEGDNTQSK